jgi:hypothetical protein
MGDTSEVGSIGVVMTMMGGGDGDDVEIVSSQSPNKRPDPNDDEGREVLQREVDALADVFVRTVATNRKVSTNHVLEKFGKGGVMLAADAIAVGMADSMETLNNWFSKEIDRKQKTAESINRPRQEAKMNLEALLKENPEAAAEVATRIDAARAEGAARSAVSAETTKKALTFLQSAEYPQTIKAIACKVIEGSATVERLEDAVTMFDAFKASKDMDDLKLESGKIPATPPQQTPALSTDGVIRSAQDIDAVAAAMKAGR